MARGLAAAGATIAIAARDKSKANEALSTLRALNVRAEFVPVDVADEKSCEEMVENVRSLFGAIDILINSAGIAIGNRAENLSLGDWRKVLDTNLTSSFLCSQLVHPDMAKRGGGKIINIGSMYSIFGNGMAANYAASKGGVVQLTKALACGWAKDNIQVNAVLPGWIETDMTARVRDAKFDERVLRRTPARRWGTPDDLAGIAVFLASPASNFITGTAIPVDGGFSVEG